MKIFLISWLILITPALVAAPPAQETIRMIADNYLAKRPVPILAKGFSMDEGLKAQRSLVDLLSAKLGPVAGYKIGLITKPNQERMGATGPVHGVLLEQMLLANGATVPANFGIRPALEIDIGVLVKDEGINHTATFEEALSHLSHLVCFIELVDTITATNQTMDAALLTSLNVGARAGVLGERTELTPAVVKALPNMKMTLTDNDGKTIAEIPRLALQPLQNIPWLTADLKKEGRSLKAGDFISLGSPGTPQPIPAGQTIFLKYDNLPSGPLRAKVVFEK